MKQLKDLIESHGLSCNDCLEKCDLIERAHEALSGNSTFAPAEAEEAIADEKPVLKPWQVAGGRGVKASGEGAKQRGSLWEKSRKKGSKGKAALAAAEIERARKERRERMADEKARREAEFKEHGEKTL